MMKNIVIFLIVAFQVVRYLVYIWLGLMILVSGYVYSWKIDPSREVQFILFASLVIIFIIFSYLFPFLIKRCWPDKADRIKELTKPRRVFVWTIGILVTLSVGASMVVSFLQI